MKRWTIIFNLVLMLFLPTVEAVGFFEDTSLVLVVYNEEDNELGVDLGNVLEMDFAAEEVTLAPSGTISFNRFGPTITQWGQLNAGCFASTDDWAHGFFCIPQKTDPGVSESQIVTFKNSAAYIRNLAYKHNSPDSSTATVLASHPNSYDTRMNSNSISPGRYSGYRGNHTSGDGDETNLADLATIGHVDMYLFHYAPMNALDKGPNLATDYTAVIRIKADGSVVLNPQIVNQPPTDVNAAASPNPANEGASVTLTGNAQDPDGDSLTYTWSTAYALTGFPKTGAEVTFEAPEVGTSTQIELTLSVSDGINDPTTDTVTVTVNPGGDPVADAGGAQQVLPGATVTLDGSASSDSDGQIVSFQWQQSPQDAVQVVIIDTNPNDGLATFQAPGENQAPVRLTFTLTVTDNEDKTDTDACIVDVIPPEYTPPQADAGPDQTVWENEEVTLDGSGSSGDQITYQWTQESGPINVQLIGNTSQTAGFTAPVLTEPTGTFVFMLTVSDPTGIESTDTVTITVKKNLPPTAPSSALTPTNEAGVWESDVLTPSLAVNNAADTEGDVLTYEFELYNSDSAIPENYVFGAAQVPEGETITTWTTPLLEENTLYYLRARANDGFQDGPWMDLAAIFINSIEEHPGVPAISSPAAGSSVATATPVLEVTNTVDPDMDPLTYEFGIYLNPTDPTYSPYLTTTGVLEGTEGTTQWTVPDETPLEENVTYWWRARAVDDTGLAGDWTDPAVFLVNSANQAPEPPAVRYPQDGSEIDTPDPIFEIEETLDPEGDPITFYVEIDTLNTFDSPNLIQSEALEVTSALTTWSVPQTLDENTTYHYRIKASDGEAESAWSNGAFFVNQHNDPPDAPVIRLPENMAKVTTLTPTLITTEADDPDLDAVTYEFELFLAGDLTDPIESVSDLVNPEWEVPGTNLQNGKKYYWRARAVDEHGLQGEWSQYSPEDPWPCFTIGANYYQPSTPQKINPIDNGTVNTRTPVLSVVATDDGDGNSIWIEFELYRDRDLSDFVSYGMVPIGVSATSWQVDVTIEDGAEYFWRARTTDEEKYSAWTTVSRFSVDVNGESTVHIRVWEVTNYDPTVPWYTVMEVDDLDSAICGAKAILPPGALSTHETLYIGEATGTPILNDALIPVGKVVEFGPSGIAFNVPVTIKIPYTDEDLDHAGGVSPEDLNVYTYNETDGVWETISVDQVDHEEKVLICEVDHFSLYSTAAQADNINTAGDTDGNGGGGGGGGCFIHTAGTSFSGNLFGRATALPWIMVSIFVWAALRKKIGRMNLTQNQ